ncbi:protein of unknown function [Streptomyces sp. KY70]|nr:protein of unknown function [Streptomyces sp. KY70]
MHVGTERVGAHVGTGRAGVYKAYEAGHEAS